MLCIRLYQKHIRKLNFQNTQLDSQSGMLFKTLYTEPDLEIYYINLNKTSIGDKGLEFVLDAIKKAPNNDVRVMRCNSCNLTSLSTVKLEHVLKRKKGALPKIKLQVLTLRNNQLGNMGIENISVFLRLNNTIKYLDLSFTGIDDAGLEIISE